MMMPGFTAERSLYRTACHYAGTSSGADSRNAVSPALPGCSSCNYIFNSCYDCMDGGGTFGSCPTCKLISRCLNACDFRPAAGPGGQMDLLNLIECQQECDHNPACIDAFC
jgi:hypothetical protein